MVIIDDMTALAFRYRPATPQRHHRRCAEEALEPVIVEVYAQASLGLKLRAPYLYPDLPNLMEVKG